MLWLSCKTAELPLKEIFQKAHLSPSQLQELLIVAAHAGNHLAITEVLEPLRANPSELLGPKGWRYAHYLTKADGIFPLRKELAEVSSVMLPLAQEGNKTLPYIAAEHRSKRVLQFLLQQMYNQKQPLEGHFHDRHLFYAIAESGDLESVKMAVEIFGKDALINTALDKQNTFAPHLAARIGSKKILKYFKELGANLDAPDAKNLKPIDYATRIGSLDCVKFLLKANARIDEQTLYEAAASKKPLSEQIRSRVFSANRSSQALDAALFKAVQNHNERAFIFLHVKGGASFSYATTEGWTPLLYASHSGQSNLVRTMVQGSFDPRTYKGNTPLHLATIGKHVHCVELFLEKGYNPDQPNSEGKNSKQLAHKTPAILEILEKKGRRLRASMQAFETGLFKNDPTALKKSIKDLPFDQPIIIDTPKGMRWGPFIHLLARFSKDEDVGKCIPSNRELAKFPAIINSPDSKGNTLAHYYDSVPRIIELKELDFLCSNHKGQRPLHLAAKSASSDDLEALLYILPPEEIHQVDDQGRTPIFYAIAGRREENVKVLIHRGANLRHYDSNLFTPLILACLHGSLPLVRALLLAGADANQTVTLAKTFPLIFSIMKEQQEITRLLLFYGAKLEQLTGKGDHVIHFAAETGNVELLHYCHAKGVPLDLENNKQLTPRHLAARHGQTTFLDSLHALHPESESSSDIPSPLHFAALSETPEAFRWLLDHGANPEEKANGSGGGILCAAAESSAAKSMLAVLKPYRLSQNPRSLLPAIMRAIRQDNPDALQALYEKGVPPSSDIIEGENGLHLASFFGALQCTAWLLQRGVDPLATNTEQQTSLEIAAKNDSAEQFQLLVKEAQPPFEQKFNGEKTLAHIAAQAGKLNHLVVLMHEGYPFDEKDAHGFTPLALAAQFGHKEIVRFLLACGANPSIMNESDTTEEIQALLKEAKTLQKSAERGETRLHFAVRSKNSLAVLVCSTLDDVDEFNNENMTPLHLAVRNGEIEAIIHLLNAGADPTKQDRMGHDALWFAKQIEDPVLKDKVIKILTPFQTR
ncbi:MAG: hypothetical protein KR126chlam3_00112 [Chlamydiae bacterium]|nr:hypothetical protein [Chlamydiota bacterium]